MSISSSSSANSSSWWRWRSSSRVSKTSTTMTTMTTTTTDNTNDPDNNEHTNNDGNDNSKKKKSSSSNMKLFSSLFSFSSKLLIVQEWKTLSISLIAMTLSSLSNHLLTKSIGKFIDSNNNESSTSIVSNISTSIMSLWWSSYTIYQQMIIIVLVGTCSSMIRTYTIAIAKHRMIQTLQYQCYHSMLYYYHYKYNTTTNNNVNEDDAMMIRNNNNNKDQEEKQVLDNEEEQDIINANNVNNNNNNNKNDDNTMISPNMIHTIFYNDIEQISTIYTTTFINMLRGVLSISFSIYNMICIDSQLVLYSCSIIPVIGIVSMKIRSKIKYYTNLYNNILYNHTHSYICERLRNIEYIYMTNYESNEIYHYKNNIQKQLYNIKYNIILYDSILMGFLFLCTSASLISIINYGQYHMIHTKRITSGQLTSYTTYSLLLGLGTSSFIKSLLEIYNTINTNVYNIYPLLYKYYKNNNTNNDDTNTITTAPQPSSLLFDDDNNNYNKYDDIQSISLNHVSFTYYDNNYYKQSSSLLLNDINITLQRGNIIGLLGKNGSGKSTISKLLCGLYQPTNGTITVSLLSKGTSTTATTVDKSMTEMKEIDLHELLQSHRKQIQNIQEHDELNSTKKCIVRRQQRPIVLMIPQEIVLFHQMSIYDNVRYGLISSGNNNDKMMEYNVISALKQANCYDAILQQFPEHGIHTIIGSNDNSNNSTNNVNKKNKKSDNNNNNQHTNNNTNIELSGGMKQRIMLARIILQQPYFVIMDEPMNHMDDSGIQAVYDIIQQCRMNHIGLLLITHHIPTLLNSNFDCIYLLGKQQEQNEKDNDNYDHNNSNTIIDKGTLEELLYTNHGQGEVQEQQPGTTDDDDNSNDNIMPTNQYSINTNSYLCELMPSLLVLPAPK